MSLRIRRVKAGGCCPDVSPLEERGGRRGWSQWLHFTPQVCKPPPPDTHKWGCDSLFIRVSTEWWKAWQQLLARTRVRARRQIETWQTLKEQMQTWSKYIRGTPLLVQQHQQESIQLEFVCWLISRSLTSKGLLDKRSNIFKTPKPIQSPEFNPLMFDHLDQEKRTQP